MNTKFNVPYKTAQLLKENGYNIETDYYYNKETKMITPLQALKDEWYPDSLQIIINTRYIPAPTYHEVLDWINGKGYYIFSLFDDSFEDGENAWYCCIRTKPLQPDKLTEYYSTREEALNAAIIETIQFL